jgi:hypothetical protein
VYENKLVNALYLCILPLNWTSRHHPKKTKPRKPKKKKKKILALMERYSVAVSTSCDAQMQN